MAATVAFAAVVVAAVAFAAVMGAAIAEAAHGRLRESRCRWFAADVICVVVVAI
jgi:hypothetical protein